MDVIAPQQASTLLRRIIAFPLTLLVIEFAVVMFAAILAQNAAHLTGFPRDSATWAGMAALAAAFVALVYIVCCRWLERGQSAASGFAPSAAVCELGGGLVLGAVLFCAMAGVVAMMGGMEVVGLRRYGQFWAILAMAISSGVIEEVLFRGIVFRHLETMLGSWAALALTALLFGGAHLANSHASLFAALAIALEAGLMLGGAYMLSRRLWLPIGIHAAWNFTQGWVFSVPVSGAESPLGVLVTRRVGPDWLTGGDFGLEASAVAMVLATLAGGAMVWFAVRRGKLVSLRFQPPRQPRVRSRIS
ncbi:MAG: CPBP family intramembrane glutamic endopeptidase [Novosphingobium sp.]